MTPEQFRPRTPQEKAPQFDGSIDLKTARPERIHEYIEFQRARKAALRGSDPTEAKEISDAILDALAALIPKPEKSN